MSVKMSIRQVGDVTVIDAAGRITLGEGSSAFRDTVKDLVSKGNKKILLNLADISYIDSSGIGEMVSGFTSVSNACAWRVRSQVSVSFSWHTAQASLPRADHRHRAIRRSCRRCSSRSLLCGALSRTRRGICCPSRLARRPGGIPR